jgi:hypothetical protein
MGTSSISRTGKSQRLPKTRLGLLYVVTFAVGLTPYILIVGSWLVGLAALVLLEVIFGYAAWQSSDEYAGETPSSTEIAFTALGRCSAGAVVGLLGIGAYYGGSAILPHLGVADVTANAIGFYTSTAIVAFFTLALASGDVPDVLHALYPARPGQRSPYFPLSTKASGRRILASSVLVLTVLAGAVAATTYIEPLGRYFVWAVVALDFALVALGADYLEAKSLDATYMTPDTAIVAIKTLLEAAGYLVIARPRTGKSEVDSVISILDFLALRSDDAIAGRVRARATDQDASDILREAASLEPAVWVLEDELQEQQHDKIRVKPVLLVLGDAPGVPKGDTAGDPKQATEAAWSAGKAVRIVRVPSEDELTAMNRADDKGPLNSAAARLFGVPSSPVSAA